MWLSMFDFVGLVTLGFPSNSFWGFFILERHDMDVGLCAYCIYIYMELENAYGRTSPHD